MPSPAILAIAALGLSLAIFVGFFVYVMIRYGPVVRRIFEDAPVFHPLRVDPVDGGEDVRFPTADGLELAGTYLRSRAPQRAGVVVFCHEYLSDRWAALPYADGLRALGFDLFTFDFRNHGDSPTDPAYRPYQWVSDHEVRDLRAALAYLRTRPDADAAGVGLFGISRGGGADLCVAADDPRIWGVVTDGAFPTHGTMMAYIDRWAEIYVGRISFWMRMPRWVFSFVAWSGRTLSEWRSGRRHPHMERAVGRLAPRPWLAIHGANDNYISPNIARELFNRAGEPKDLWVVPKAKHNRCREADPAAYDARVSGFFRAYAPRRLPEPAAEELGPAAAVPRRNAVVAITG